MLTRTDLLSTTLNNLVTCTAVAVFALLIQRLAHNYEGNEYHIRHFRWQVKNKKIKDFYCYRKWKATQHLQLPLEWAVERQVLTEWVLLYMVYCPVGQLPSLSAAAKARRIAQKRKLYHIYFFNQNIWGLAKGVATFACVLYSRLPHMPCKKVACHCTWGENCVFRCLCEAISLTLQSFPFRNAGEQWYCDRKTRHTKCWTLSATTGPRHD